MIKNNNKSGQAAIEYVMLLLIIMGFVKIVFNYLPQGLNKLEESFTERYTASYQFGDMRTKGGEDGFEFHPRAPGATNFRMWKRMR